MATTVPPPPRTGTASHFGGLMKSGLRYLSARLALAGLEAKEAIAHYGIAAALALAGAFLAALGYVLLITTVVFGIAAAFDGKHAWIWVMAVAALLHIGAAVALVLLGLRRARGSAFSSTLGEFQKDKEWLTNLANNH